MVVTRVARKADTKAEMLAGWLVCLRAAALDSLKAESLVALRVAMKGNLLAELKVGGKAGTRVDS